MLASAPPLPSPIDEDGEEVPSCETEPYEDEFSRSACADCGEQFYVSEKCSSRRSMLSKATEIKFLGGSGLRCVI